MEGPNGEAWFIVGKFAYLNPSLKMALVALAAFLTWKATWAIRSAQFTKSRAPF